jgi:hypothetical protein
MAALWLMSICLILLSHPGGQMVGGQLPQNSAGPIRWGEKKLKIHRPDRPDRPERAGIIAYALFSLTCGLSWSN